jgi:beta-galactosidase
MRLPAFVGMCLSLSLIVALAGCGGSIAPASTPPPANHTAPSIMSQPSSKTVAAGETATFSATATGSTPLTYQWQRDQVAISGATSASYTTPPVSTTDNGAHFRVVVSNSVGNATSNAATLTVSSSSPPPTIVYIHACKTVYPG